MTQSRYQLVTTSDGNAYRLDTVTGGVKTITPKGMLAVPDSIALLNIGEFYEATDLKDGTKYLKYLGNGAFERRDEMHMLLDKYGGRNPAQR